MSKSFDELTRDVDQLRTWVRGGFDRDDGTYEPGILSRLEAVERKLSSLDLMGRRVIGYIFRVGILLVIFSFLNVIHAYTGLNLNGLMKAIFG